METRFSSLLCVDTQKHFQMSARRLQAFRERQTRSRHYENLINAECLKTPAAGLFGALLGMSKLISTEVNARVSLLFVIASTFSLYSVGCYGDGQPEYWEALGENTSSVWSDWLLSQVGEGKQTAPMFQSVKDHKVNKISKLNVIWLFFFLRAQSFKGLWQRDRKCLLCTQGCSKVFGHPCPSSGHIQEVTVFL